MRGPDKFFIDGALKLPDSTLSIYLSSLFSKMILNPIPDSMYSNYLHICLEMSEAILMAPFNRTPYALPKIVTLLSPIQLN